MFALCQADDVSTRSGLREEVEIEDMKDQENCKETVRTSTPLGTFFSYSGWRTP